MREGQTGGVVLKSMGGKPRHIPAAEITRLGDDAAEFGMKRAQRMLGLKIHTPETPTPEALAEAARRYHLSAVRFTART